MRRILALSSRPTLCDYRLAAGVKLKAVTEIGKILIFFGGLLLVVGILFLLLDRTHLPIGRLPGDILYRGKNTTFYFPLTTSIIISVILSVVFYVLSRIRK